MSWAREPYQERLPCPRSASSRAEPRVRVCPDATLGMTDGGRHDRAQGQVTTPGQESQWASRSQSQWSPAAGLWGPPGADGSSR